VTATKAGRLFACRHKAWSLWLWLSLFLLAGCSLPEVRFSVQQGARVQLPGVQRLAVLDFASPFSRRDVGEAFAVEVANFMATRGDVQVLNPQGTRPILASMRLMASAFNDPSVVAEAGKNLGVDALLFGDVRTAEIVRTVRREAYTYQTGVRQETVNETGADGRTHTATYAYPETKESWRDHIKRTFIFHGEARLVSVQNAHVLWQESTDLSQETAAEEEENGTRKGDWSTDEEFSHKQMHLAAQQLLGKLLPQVLSRARLLAEAGDDGPYAEWIKAGNQAAVAGHWDQAGEDWLKAKSLNSNRPEAQANLGVFYEQQGEFQQAVQAYDLVSRPLGKPWSDYAWEVKKFLEPPKAN